jgi:hypothetical protein
MTHQWEPTTTCNAFTHQLPAKIFPLACSNACCLEQLYTTPSSWCHGKRYG